MREAIRSAFFVMVRPFYGFGELKYEKKNRVGMAWILVALAAAAYLIRMIYTGPAFSAFNPRTFNLLRVLGGLSLSFFLFVGGNWAVSTILDGEGTMREIFTVCGYALLPYLLTALVATLLSHMLIPDESYLIAALETGGALWSLLLLFAGLTVMHQYTAGKTVAILLLTLILMAIVLFVMILLASIADQIVSYISSLISEIKLRV